jgi:hypothetical protein
MTPLFANTFYFQARVNAHDDKAWSLAECLSFVVIKHQWSAQSTGKVA